MPKNQWYDFVANFLQLSRQSFIMLPSREEAKKKAVWNHEMLDEWYGKYDDPQDLISKILLDRQIPFTIKTIGEWYSSYGEGKRKMILVDLAYTSSIGIDDDVQEFLNMLPDVQPESV